MSLLLLLSSHFLAFTSNFDFKLESSCTCRSTNLSSCQAVIMQSSGGSHRVISCNACEIEKPFQSCFSWPNSSFVVRTSVSEVSHPWEMYPSMDNTQRQWQQIYLPRPTDSATVRANFALWTFHLNLVQKYLKIIKQFQFWETSGKNRFLLGLI